MGANYTEQDYRKDLEFVQRCSFRLDDDAMGKLEVMIGGPGNQLLYIGHSGLPSKFLHMKTAYLMLENEVVLNQHIMRKNSELQFSEFVQIREECLSLISKRARKLFETRYNGALKRIARYERNLAMPYLKQLRGALRTKDADKVYETAERIGIVTENFSVDHPMVREYAGLEPLVDQILQPWKPELN